MGRLCTTRTAIPRNRHLPGETPRAPLYIMSIIGHRRADWTLEDASNEGFKGRASELPCSGANQIGPVVVAWLRGCWGCFEWRVCEAAGIPRWGLLATVASPLMSDESDVSGRCGCVASRLGGFAVIGQPDYGCHQHVGSAAALCYEDHPDRGCYHWQDATTGPNIGPGHYR